MRNVRGAGEAYLMLVVLDADGVWHEVYNKTEIRQISYRYWAENWLIRTLCSMHNMLDSFRLSISRATLSEDSVATCVRCAVLVCDHGIRFEESVVRRFTLSPNEVRSRWPRLDGACPKGCGYHGIAYASRAHYIYGDW